MKIYQKILIILAGLCIAIPVIAAPVSNLFRSLVPETDNTYFIGTTTPSTLRYNSLTVGTGTSTFANGIQLTGGCFRLPSGSCAGSATPGGLNTQVQFNDNGILGGDSNLTWNKATKNLTVFTTITVPNVTSASGNNLILTSPADDILATTVNNVFKLNNTTKRFEFSGIGGVASLNLDTLPSDRTYTFPNWSGEFVISTSTTQVSAINATNTAATSTFAGPLYIASSTPTGNALFAVGTSSPLLWVDRDTGNVGIGTANPTSLLHLYGTTRGAATEILVKSTNASTASSRLRLLNDLDETGQISLVGSTASNANLLLAPSSLNVSNSGSGGVIIDATHANGVVRFATGGTAASNERMRIDSSGNVGIGTTTPTAKFAIGGVGSGNFGGFASLSAITSNSSNSWSQVYGSAATTTFMAFWTDSVDATAGTLNVGSQYKGTVMSWNPNTGNVNVAQGNLGVGTSTPNNKLDIFSTTKAAIGFSGAAGDTYKWTMGMDVTNGGRFSIASSTALGTNDRLVIDGSGNVGIGTTSPAALLSVQGNALISGTSTVGSLIATSTLFVGGSTGSSLYVAGGRVGVGTTSPTATFAIGGAGSGNFGGFASLSVLTSNNFSIYSTIFGSAATTSFIGLYTNSGAAIGGSLDFGSQYVDPIMMLNPNTGFVGIGTTSPGTLLAVAGTADITGKTTMGSTVYAPNSGTSGSSQTGYWCYDANGQLIRNTVICIAVSSKRFKENIKPLDIGLNELLQLTPVSYKLKPTYNTLFKDNPNYNDTQYGLIAEDLQKVIPRLVTVETATTTFEGVTYPPGTVHGLADTGNWVGFFTKAIQDFYGKFQKLIARVSGLEQRINQQDIKIKKLEERLNKLEHK